MSRLPGRVATGIAILVLVLISVRLILELFMPITPVPVAHLVGQGAALVYAMVAPALPPATALLLLWGALWLFGRGRR